MVRSAVLEFWQPVAVWGLAQFRANANIRGAILADAVGLGKTWETIAFMLKCWSDYNTAYETAVKHKEAPPVARPFLIVVPQI
ncbi:uncharacterized protein ATNIH1004_011508 [Aspergillus tanneri]|uniref:SNF2 N-terminal domain-containing protein n=1 Tax=Aspergillus tanneri TaxID=1220188 RepID=A0A5M9MC93_9EURO|nr:uncharacterized protein ATNIH1004_011508 [Aspergillus tanneri]KAA8642563.1 hypothetical protein ATNIH1004_011508 [Aspergillus tanneri]